MKKAKADRLSPIPRPSKRKESAAPTPDGDSAPAAPDLSHISAGLRHLARPIAELQFHPRNPRKHPERNIEAIRASLRQNGQYRPAVASDRTGQLVVVVGNGMLAAALAEGWTHLAVEPKSLTEAKENQLAITDNETAALATWDQELLGALMRDVDTGNDPDLDRMLAELGEREKVVDLRREAAPDPGPQMDRAKELQAKWGVKPGDLFLIPSKTVPGKAHRLLCGDSTKVEDVERVMGGEQADLCFTSPPYAQQREYEGGIGDWDGLMEGVFGNLPMADDGQVLVNLGIVHKDGEWWPYWDGWIEWMRGQGWRRFGWYVWDKLAGMPGDWNGRLAPSHEFIFHFNCLGIRAAKWVQKKPESIRVAKGSIGRDGNEKHMPDSPLASLQPTKVADSVVRISCRVNRDVANEHPAVFPVQLPVEIMLSWPGLAYEPFAGSGTTIVAAEQTGRLCYGIEISPSYTAVALERLAGFGLEPKLAE